MWESYKLDPYVQRLADALINFQEKVIDLLPVIGTIITIDWLFGNIWVKGVNW